MVRALVLLHALFLSGCALLSGGTEPLKTERYSFSAGTADTLIVLLPGIYDGNQAFAREAFMSTAWEHGIRADFVAADTDVGYFMADTVVERLRQDVFLPARAKGYRNIWLVGVSLGGLGALAYVRRHPEDVHGVLLLSPYLGGPRTIGPIERAGSLAAWQPQEECAEKDFCSVWLWLQQYTGQAGVQGEPEMFLGYGSEDRFPAAHQLLAQALGSGRSMVVSGAHNWDTWRALWQRYLEREADRFSIR